MNLLDRWTERLNNWALWEVSGSWRSVRIASYDGQWWESPPRQTIPLVGDALDVDRLLHRLHNESLAGKLQYQAVRIHFLWTGAEDMKARQAGIAARTLRERVFRAKFSLDDLEHKAKRNNQLHTGPSGVYLHVSWP